MFKAIVPLVLLVVSGPALAAHAGNLYGASNRLAGATDRLYHNLSYTYADSRIVNRAARLAERAHRLNRRAHQYRSPRKLGRDFSRLQRDFARLDRAIYRAGPFHGKRQVVSDLRRVARALHRVESTLTYGSYRTHRRYEKRYAQAW